MDGKCWLLLPFLHAQYIENIARINALYIIHKINILSYVESQPHVSIFCISKNNTGSFYSDFIIYNGKGIYSNSMNAIMKYFYLDLIADNK